MGFETAVTDGVLRVRIGDGDPGRGAGRWLSTGPEGGFRRADAAYNVTVPEGWSRTDPAAYAAERRAAAGFAAAGPALLTGVGMDHARGARLGSVLAVATVGLSNPAGLPAPAEPPGAGEGTPDAGAPPRSGGDGEGEVGGPPGTVNVVLATARALDDASLTTLLGVAVEAKAATLLRETPFPGTTTDAVVAGTDPDGEPATFAGSATPVGGAARACVREAVTASLRSRCADRAVPPSVGAAEHGVVTDERAEVFEP